MPLPPLPQNNTDRAWLQYTAGGVEHEAVFRFPSATAQASIVTALQAWANTMKAAMRTTDSFTGLRHQDSGSTVSFPLAWTSIAGTINPATEADEEPKFMALSGRSLQGYRCRLTFFTQTIADSLGYRQQENGNAMTDLLLDATDALGNLSVAVDGQPVIWNRYINIGYNAYWQRQSR